METKTPEARTRDVPSVQINIDFGNLENKDSKNPVKGRMMKRVLNLFLSGDEFSVLDISEKTGSLDPRGHIRSLRNRGIPILDRMERRKNRHYKIYFLKR